MSIGVRVSDEDLVGSIQSPAWSQGKYLVGARKQELPARSSSKCRDPDLWMVICKRNGGEHAWSYSRINQRLVYQASKRRSPVCIGCEQTARDTAKSNDRWRWAGPAVAGDAESEGRSKEASTDTGLSDVGISYDQSSPRQKLTAIRQEILEREVHDRKIILAVKGLPKARLV